MFNAQPVAAVMTVADAQTRGAAGCTAACSTLCWQNLRMQLQRSFQMVSVGMFFLFKLTFDLTSHHAMSRALLVFFTAIIVIVTWRRLSGRGLDRAAVGGVVL